VYSYSYSSVVQTFIQKDSYCSTRLPRSEWSKPSAIASRRLLPRLSLLTLTGLSLLAMQANASLPTRLGATLTSLANSSSGGFWIQVDRMQKELPSETLPIDGAPTFQDIPFAGSIAAIPDGKGYHVVTADGRIFSRGEAPELCGGLLGDCSGFPRDPGIRDDILGAASTPTGEGLWAVGRDGTVWAVGDARFYGDVRGSTGVPTAIVGTPYGKGYYVVMDDGKVFNFGDAQFYGSTGGEHPEGTLITGLALSLGDDGKVNGYWLVTADGKVYNFGGASYGGSGNSDKASVTGIVSFPTATPNSPPQRTRGYATVDTDGKVIVRTGF
jgi:hypothetical protein